VLWQVEASSVYHTRWKFKLTTSDRGEFRPRQLPGAVDLKGRFLFLVVVKC
jgi:hypothetical protein